MKYSTTIAIFLGHVKAQWAGLANGNCSIDTVTDATLESQLTTCSSLAECAADADCADEDEKCGYYTWTASDSTTVEDGKCVYKYACGDVGLMEPEQTPWQLLCFDDTEPETLPDTTVIFANVEDIVNVAEVKDWSTGDIATMKIPSRDNYQTGHWILADDKWGETDKAVNNLCTANTDCATGECCANWPDSNSLRCISSDLAGVEQSIPPFSAFTPACAVNTNQAPTSAKDDLAQEAQAKAAEELDTFADKLRDEQREEDGFDEMTVEEEEAWDETWAEGQLEVEARDASDRENAGYADMDNSQKAVFDSELLKWKEAVYEQCKSKFTSIECRKADEIRADTEAKRLFDDYYTEMDAEAREIFDADEEATISVKVSELTAAWQRAYDPTQGSLDMGQKCSAENPCKDEEQCCGDSTPDTSGADQGAVLLTGRCAMKATLKWSDEIGINYTHVCGAQKLMATVTALFAIASLM